MKVCSECFGVVNCILSTTLLFSPFFEYLICKRFLTFCVYLASEYCFRKLSIDLSIYASVDKKDCFVKQSIRL